MTNSNIVNPLVRNIAIIAHVDHGKTTLVNAMFSQSGAFRNGQEIPDRLMDNMELEKERGITILAKNCSVEWKGVKINILDTPGHADFGGEVERALSMVDGVILLVDASEGPLPQTRFVLDKALSLGHSVILVINKVDRPDSRITEVLSNIYDLFIDLGANDSQLDFPVFYAIGKEGKASTVLEEVLGENSKANLYSLFDAIIEKLPAPQCDKDKPFQMLVSDLSYSDYFGRLAIGKIANGHVHYKDNLVCIAEDNSRHNLNVTKIQTYNTINIVDTNEANAGDIIVLAGIEDVKIGDTICSCEDTMALPRIKIDEPTVSMRFCVNTSPLSGLEGKKLTSTKLLERLKKESLKNVSIRVDEENVNGGFLVSGRGEFQLVILIETLRREGLEIAVTRPEVIYKYIDNKKMEPIEHMYVDCDADYAGNVTDKISTHKGYLLDFVAKDANRVHLEFSVPARALIGYRDKFLTDTKGTGILNTIFSGYEEYRGDFEEFINGSLVSDQSGKGVTYGLYHLEPRGQLFIRPGEPVYEGMVVGIHNLENDLVVNPSKEKKLSNMRSVLKDEALTLTPIQDMTLERAILLLHKDEMVEVTPKSIRIRKIILNALDRKMNKREESWLELK